ncbi:hypothetical protein ILYODFUR_035748, partial [Ilyodon furcidens]
LPLNGVTTWGGSNTPTTLMSPQPLVIHLLRFRRGTNLRYSHQRKRTSRFLPYNTTYGDVNEFGTPPVGRFTRQLPETSVLQNVEDYLLLVTSLVRRFGSPHGTSHLSPCPENSLPGSSPRFIRLCN